MTPTWKTDRPTEDDELRTVVSWLESRAGLDRFDFHHSPNETDLLGLMREMVGKKRALGYLKNLRKKGVSKGFPDLIIFKEPPNYPDHQGVALELKRTPRKNHKGREATEEQQEWLRRLKDRGYLVAVPKGGRKAITLLEKAGY